MLTWKEISPVLLVDGEIAGVWEHRESKGRLRVQISPYLGVSADITVGGFVVRRGRKNPGRSPTRREAPA